MLNYLAFRLHRLMRRWQRLVAGWRHGFDLYVHGRWHQLRLVRRFVIIWLLIFGLAGIEVAWQIHRLHESSIALQPVPGGTFIEGEVGSATILNPVLPDTPASQDINSLIFDGLTKWGPNRQLQPDLASSWSVSSDDRTYTFHLRHDVKWQDGVPFTAQDVLFTLQAIQNPDSRSPLASSWQGVTATAPDNYTVVYTLPTPYPPFIESTTVGIVPRHALENVDPAQLRTTGFDQHPIGTGPFKVESFMAGANQVVLQANPSYFGGQPKLDGFTFHFYPTAQAALTAYAQHQTDSISQVSSNISAQAAKQPDLLFYDHALPSATTLFYNMTNGVLNDHAVRLALDQATNRQALINASEPNLAIPASQPLLPQQPGYTTQYRQDQYNPAAAATALQAAGWKLGSNGLRSKNGQELKLTVVTLQGSSLQTMAQALAKQWRTIGVQLNVRATDLSSLEQSYIRPRNFQMLLYGIDIGADPDVYPYWHSSQAADPGLNLSQYKSPAADTALESGRLKTDAALRAAKYNAFLKAWDTDQPAMVIATPVYRYAVTAAATGPFAGPIVEPSDRFANVVDWTILRQPIQR